MRLEDKVVMISGVGPGMGSAIALLFAQEGARVALVARKAVVIDVIAREIGEQNNDRAIVVQADAAEKSQMEDAVAHTIKSFGRLDVFISLPGGGFRHTKDLPEILLIVDDQYQRVFRHVFFNYGFSLFSFFRARRHSYNRSRGK